MYKIYKKQGAIILDMTRKLKFISQKIYITKKVLKRGKGDLKMISLKEARQKVINIIGQDKVPAYSTLRDWTSKGFISGVIEGTSRGAKYPDHIIYEIITAIKLKNEHNIKLTQIAK